MPDAVIQASARKADEEAIPEGMDDEDNAASGRLGAANGEHTSLAGHYANSGRFPGSVASHEAARVAASRAGRSQTVSPGRNASDSAWPRVS